MTARTALEQSIEQLVQMALMEDLGEPGDVTSKATLPTEDVITGRILAKAPGVFLPKHRGSSPG
jgi:nicotinate-nucleotide pyrophosphorylase